MERKVRDSCGKSVAKGDPAGERRGGSRTARGKRVPGWKSMLRFTSPQKNVPVDRKRCTRLLRAKRVIIFNIMNCFSSIYRSLSEHKLDISSFKPSCHPIDTSSRENTITNKNNSSFNLILKQ
ncbi:hypothetical protein KEH51_18640 [[Brevibacterium] frigoritolerans]|uniref:Uncharacterized protein n=1 Tax=Peribacillus frigoritolerans TaxID=450367 RepID=A0A941FME1_9BACI|nr:hypothetical protein [Peribacillus frigoritolerans]